MSFEPSTGPSRPWTTMPLPTSIPGSQHQQPGVAAALLQIRGTAEPETGTAGTFLVGSETGIREIYGP